MAQIRSRTQGLNGLPALAYVGVLPNTPTNFITNQRDPTTNDYKNVYIGDLWLNNASMYASPATLPTIKNLWILVSVAHHVATWRQFGEGTVITLTGNTGGPVPSDVNGNINVVGDATTITVVGNPGTNTLTISTVGTGVVNTLTGNTGGAVSPLAGNINVVGDGTTITVTGNPGTHTLTIAALNAGTITGLHTDDGHTVTPTAGIINLAGAHGLNTTGTIGPNTATVQINNAITLGDLANLGAGVAALNAQTGDITITANAGIGNLNLPVTISPGNAGVITQGGTGFANRVFYTGSGNSIYIGAQAGNLTNTGGGTSVCIGYQSGMSFTTGGSATAVGYGAMASATSSTSSSAFGNLALTDLTSGIDNTAIGFHALTELISGSHNSALGDEVADQLLTGSYNLLIGSNGTAGSYTGAESSNILLMHSGVTGESNVMRLGTTGSGNGMVAQTFIAAVRGVTTVNNNAIAVLVDSAGQLGTVSSSREVKENINDMGSYSDVIHNLRPVTFNYKQHSSESISVGLIAEEVNDVAPLLVAGDGNGGIHSVKYQDLVPMLLNEVQKLQKRIAILEGVKNV